MSYMSRKDLDFSDSAPLPPPKVVDTDTQAMIARSQRSWEQDHTRGTPLWRLRVAESYLTVARSKHHPESPILAERIEWLRGTVARILRDEADPAQVLADPHTRGLVRELFGEEGVERLYRRAKG